MSSPNKQPKSKLSGTDSVSKKQSFQEWAAAGGGVPLQYKGREHVWDRKVKQYAEGGGVDMAGGGIARLLKGASKAQAAAEPNYKEISGMVAKMGEEGRSPIIPVPNRWFLNPDKFPNQQKLVERVLDKTGKRREDFPSGAFIDPRTGEVLDSRIMNELGVVIDPKTNRPMMSAKGEAGIEQLDPKTGAYTKSNLVRKGLFKPEGGDPLLNDLNFLATIEKGDVGHKYGLATEYASPAELWNTGTGANPTLRPRSRGDLFGLGDVVGQVRVGRSEPHDVYEKLFVAPKGSDVQGVKLSKAKGGAVHMQVGGIARLLKGAKGPQSEALALAQQRAALPPSKGGLGLPPNNTPEQRAAAMGFDTPAVHFSRHGVDADTLDSGKFAIAPFDAVGTHVGSKKAARERFDNTVGYKINNPQYANDEIKGSSYPVVIKNKRQLLDSAGKPSSESALSTKFSESADYGNLRESNAKLREELFSDYDSIPYINDVEAAGSVSYIVPPENIRSRFAAFDPFRKDAATAAALGVAAPNLLAKEQKKAEGGAAFGVFPQMKPRRAKQDREAAKNVPVDLARGFVSGVLGAPGDIESFARLPYELITGNESPTFLPTSEDIEKRLPFRSEAPVSRAASGAGQLAGGFYMGPGSPLRAVGALPGAIKHGAKEFAKASAAGAPRVVKPKGGNWAAQSLEKSLKGLKRNERTPGFIAETEAHLEKLRPSYDLSDPRDARELREMEEHLGVLKNEFALNQWIDRNLGNYVKKEMGTPEDPVRLMFDRRGKEIEAQFAKDMERVKRVEERAANEPDPRRQANLQREAERLRVEANAERDLATEHITHVRGNANYVDLDDKQLLERRQSAGFPAEGMAQSDAAKLWEGLSDESIMGMRAGDIQETKTILAQAQEAERATKEKALDVARRFDEHIRSTGLSEREIQALNEKTPIFDKAAIIQDREYSDLSFKYNQLRSEIRRDEFAAAQQNPWIDKLDPEARVYSGNVNSLGFDHVFDVLKQDLASGRIRPEQLNKLSVDNAIRRTTEYDADMAKKMREAQIKATEGMPVYKEYPEGYKWIELAPPKDLTGGVTLEPKAGGFDIVGPNGEDIGWAKTKSEAIRISGQHKALEDALKYEGETMGHCVGGYCPDVLEGRSRIYSLRDAKGEPHVTIEVQPKGAVFSDVAKYIGREEAERLLDQGVTLTEMIKGIPDFQYPQKIQQIKGKQNAAPKEEYLPFVQDFVRGGKWSDVGDFGNTGLRDMNRYEPLRKYLEAKGEKFDRYIPEEEFLKYEDDFLMDRLYPKDDPGYAPLSEGMKAGGPVKIAGGGAIKEALKKLLNPKAAGGEVRMDNGGAAFGQYTIGRKYQAAKKRAENADVNALPDPRTYAAISGLLGEAPDELGFSVMHPDYAGIQKAGEKGFIGGTVLGMAPGVAPMTKGLPVGASIKSTYRPHTPTKPDPDVGSRFKVTDQGGLVPRKDLDIESLEGSQAKIFPWDATSRNKLVTEVSEVPLTKPVLTEGGDDYMRDIQHVQNRIAGASNEGIAKRIMTRVNEAAAENNLFGTGTGRVFGFPIRMGEGAEMAATFPTDIALDLIKQGGLKKKEIKALDENMRNMVFEGKKSVFKNMAPFGSDEFIQQLRNGLASDKKNDISGFSAMNMRKAFMDRIGLVENQKRLGFNLPDLSGSVLAPELKGIPKGYVGNVAAELDVAGKLSKSKSSSYDTDIPGIYAGSMPNMPIEILMPKTFENLYRDMKALYPNATPEALRNMAVGAMEKRNRGISETIGPRNIDAVKTYQEGLANGEFDPNDLKQVYDFMLRKKLQLKMAKGGEVKPVSGLSTVNKLCGCHD